MLFNYQILRISLSPWFVLCVWVCVCCVCVRRKDKVRAWDLGTRIITYLSMGYSRSTHGRCRYFSIQTHIHTPIHTHTHTHTHDQVLIVLGATFERMEGFGQMIQIILIDRFVGTWSLFMSKNQEKNKKLWEKEMEEDEKEEKNLNLMMKKMRKKK